MSKNRKKSLFLFAATVIMIGILLPGRMNEPKTEPDSGKPEAAAQQAAPEKVKLVVAPGPAPVVRERKQAAPVYAPPVAETEMPAVGESPRDAYPESTLFAKEETPKSARPSRPTYYVEDDFGDDPLLPSRPAIPARHISEKKIVTDADSPLLIPGQHLANGRHLTRQFTHVIEDDDSLESIAKRYLWDESRAKDIFEENRDVLPSMTELPIGETIVIPERE